MPHPEISISYEKIDDKNIHQFKVKDNGIGIPPYAIKSIFEDFKRLNIKSETPGTGLGLTIVASLVGRQGGSICVYSDKNGSEFTFTIPSNLISNSSP